MGEGCEGWEVYVWRCGCVTEYLLMSCDTQIIDQQR